MEIKENTTLHEMYLEALKNPICGDEEQSIVKYRYMHPNDALMVMHPVGHDKKYSHLLNKYNEKFGIHPEHREYRILDKEVDNDYDFRRT